jgi:hypothetical protein
MGGQKNANPIGGRRGEEKKKNPNSKTLARRLQTQNREDKGTLNPSQKGAKPTREKKKKKKKKKATLNPNPKTLARRMQTREGARKKGRKP